MSAPTTDVQSFIGNKYEAGFVTDIEQEHLPPGLSEDTVRFISARKGEPAWMLEWRLKAFRRWQEMREPEWAHVHYPKIDYQWTWCSTACRCTPPSRKSWRTRA